MSPWNGVRFLGVVAETELTHPCLGELSRDNQIVDLLEVPLEASGSDDAEPAGRAISRIAEVVHDPRRHRDKRPGSHTHRLVIQKEVELPIEDVEQFHMHTVQVRTRAGKARLCRELAHEEVTDAQATEGFEDHRGSRQWDNHALSWCEDLC